MKTRKSIAAALVLAVAGCGGGSGAGGGGGGGGGNPPPAGTTITATFSSANGAPMPNVAATSSGPLSAWSIASVSNGKLQMTLAPGVTTYGIAYYCQNVETIFEASTSDVVSPALGCFANNSITNVTFGYDVHNVPGATQAEIDVANAAANVTSGALSGVTGTYTFSSPFTVPGGTVDIMVKALNNAGGVLGAQILTGQSLAAGGTYPLTPLTSSEVTSAQTIGAANVPAGYTVSYEGGVILNDGSRFFLPDGTGFYALPAASVLPSGAYYFAGAQASNANNSSTVAAIATANSPPASVQLPPPFTYTGPAPADDPAFAFGYGNAFTVNGTIVYESALNWGASSLSLVATKGAAGTSPSMTIPNLAAISSLFPNLPSGGVNVNWGAYVIDETPLLLGSDIPQNYNGQYAWANGNFTAP